MPNKKHSNPEYKQAYDELREFLCAATNCSKEEAKTKTTFHIKSKSTILRIISSFEKLHASNDREDPSNVEFITHLKTIAKQIPSKVPPGSKLSSDFSKNQMPPEIKTGTSKAYIVQKNNSGQQYVFKKNASGDTSFEFEKANSEVNFLLLTAKHYPKVRNVHDQYGRLGLVSKLLPNFISLEEYVARYGRVDKSYLKDILKVFCVAYTEEDPDVHYDNYGFYFDPIAKKWVVCAIDAGRATFPLTCKYNGLAPDKTDKYYIVPPKDTFPIASEDIIHFPNLTIAKPFHWLTDYPGKNLSTHITKINNSQSHYYQPDCFDIFKTDAECIETRYFMFLKRALVPGKWFQECAKTAFTSANKINSFTQHKVNRTKELLDALLNTGEFYYYIFQNKHVLTQLLGEFDQYNRVICKKHPNLIIDLNETKTTFDNIEMTMIQNMQKIITDAYAKEDSGALSYWYGLISNPNFLDSIFNNFDPFLKTTVLQCVYEELLHHELSLDNPNLNVINAALQYKILEMSNLI